MVRVDCTSFVDDAGERDPFGPTSSTLTRSRRGRDGLFASAHRGTFVLDTVDALSSSLQEALLHTLAGSGARGSAAPRRRIDARVVATARGDLDAAASKGRFRRDLRTLLIGRTIRVPPLRSRPSDVLALTRRFLARSADDSPLAEPTTDAAEALALGDWSGNVAELERVCRAALDQGAGPTLKVEHLPPAFAARLRDRTAPVPPRSSVAPPPALGVPRDRPPSKDDLEHVLARFGGDLGEVAAYFGKDRRQVHRWVEHWGVTPAQFRRQ